MLGLIVDLDPAVLESVGFSTIGFAGLSKDFTKGVVIPRMGSPNTASRFARSSACLA